VPTSDLIQDNDYHGFLRPSRKILMFVNIRLWTKYIHVCVPACCFPLHKNNIFWEIECQRLYQVTLKLKLPQLNVSYRSVKRAFKCTTDELYSRCKTELTIIIFSGDGIIVWVLHPFTNKTENHRVLKFYKNTVFCGVNKLTNFHCTVGRSGCYNSQQCNNTVTWGKECTKSCRSETKIIRNHDGS
jgi:hypothetical protein